MTFALEMKSLLIALLIALVGSAHTGDEILSVSIGDGSMVTAVAALDGVAIISENHPAELRFVSSDAEQRAITVISHVAFIQMPCDHMIIELAAEHIAMNDEILGVEKLRERLERFVEAARLTETKPVMLLDAAEGVAGAELVELLNLMHDIDTTWFVRPPGKPTERTRRRS